MDTPEVRFGIGELARAIEACATAVQACTSCADACLSENDLPTLRECIALSQNCADVCGTTARVLSRLEHSDHILSHGVLQACVRACVTCADECARHAEHHRHCEVCARACRACHHACSELLDTEAFEELRKLAGG